MDRIAIIGAMGSTGRKICQAAADRGLRVVAIDRDAPRPGDRRSGVEHRQADVLEDDLAPMIAGCEAVVSALGLPYSLHNALRPPPLHTKGTANVVRAMRRQELRRIAVISAAFVVHQPALPAWFELSVVPALHTILEQMRAMERDLAAAGDLDWTVVRPGWLLDAPAKGDLEAKDDLLAEGAFRCREGDLAAFMIDNVVEGRFIGKRPAVGAPDTAFNESPLAVCGLLTRGLRSLIH